MIKQEKSRDLSISFVRMVAMLFIVVCHLLQYYEIELAFYFNVGVPIFLLLSGYLYGKKDRVSFVPFMISRAKRILTDYWVLLIFLIPIYKIRGFSFTAVNIIKLIFGVSSGVSGLAHFWFVSTILFCYLITPICLDVLNRKNGVLFLILLGPLACEVLQELLPFFTGAWIYSYLCGLVLGRVSHRQGRNIINRVFVYSLPLTILCNAIACYLKYFSQKDFPHWFMALLAHGYGYCHLLLGLSIMLVLLIAFERIPKTKILEKALNLSDKYSYDIYLTHHIFLLGPFSALAYFNSFLGAVVAFAATAISSALLNIISNKILRQQNFSSGGGNANR